MVPEDKAESISVTKDEVLKWGKIRHKALWPVVIEIAYAKFRKNHKIVDLTTINVEKIKNYIQEEIKHKSKYKGLPEIKIKEIIEEKFKTKELKKILRGGSVNSVLTNLTGEPTPIVDDLSNILNRDINLKKFPILIEGKVNYTSEVNDIFNKIVKNLKNKKSVVAGISFLSDYNNKFDKNRSQKNFNIYIYFVLNFKSILKENASDYDIDKSIENFFQQVPFKEDKLIKWCDKKGTEQNFEILKNKKSKEEIKKALKTIFKRTSSVEERENLFQEISSKVIDFEKFGKIEGMFTGHGYAVVDAFEDLAGYKYIVIKNPHGKLTRINYTKSKKLKELIKNGNLKDKIGIKKDGIGTKIIDFEGKTVDSGSGDISECVMELNDFCKKIDEIIY